MKLYVVGFGPGGYEGMTLEAKNVILESEIIIGYTTYIRLLEPLFPGKTFMETGMKRERERVKLAISQAKQGRIVSLVCSGDSGVYGMAGLALEMGAELPALTVDVIPGVTAAISGGAALGAPLSHDFCVISLSDLLTPWEKIEKRLTGAAMADFVIALYNPASKNRRDYLKRACDILLRYKSGDTVCGIVRNIGRPGEEKQLLTLAGLTEIQADMVTTVFVGNSETRVINGKMVTPRGYGNV